MRRIAVTGLMLFLAACAAHEPRCHSALRPVNTSPPRPVTDNQAAMPR